MQLNDIIERYSVSDISKKTNIAKEDVETLFQGEFEKLTRVKALGFISILEREYKIDLSVFRDVALAHYNQHHNDHPSVVLSAEYEDDKGGSSKLFVLFVLLLLGGASWYFFTQFDKKLLNGILPFVDEEITQMMGEDVNESEALSIESVTLPATSQSSVIEDSSVEVATTTTESEVVADESESSLVEESSVTMDDNSTTVVETN